MNLFFETNRQAFGFLFAMPLGFFLAMCLSCSKIAGIVGLVWDALAQVGAGMLLLLISSATYDTGIRLYHLLGALIGMILYLCGVNRAIGLLSRRIALWKEKRKSKEEFFIEKTK